MGSAFVILIHSGYGPRHFDLMLEAGDALATWRLNESPAFLNLGQSQVALKLPDHRTAYLEHEGSLSRGRGQVRPLDRGQYRLLGRDDDAWRVELRGRVIRGLFELRRDKPAGDQWTLTRLEEQPATAGPTGESG